MNNKFTLSGKLGFSIIEVMVAIFIFSLGLSAVLMVLFSTSKANVYNKNSIIASNLAREQIELIRNIRDTNYKKFQKWNTLKPYSSLYNKYDITFRGSPSFYKIENDYHISSTFHIISSTGSAVPDFTLSLEQISDTSENTYRLCLDSTYRYVFCNSSTTLTPTPFYRYLYIQPLRSGSLSGPIESKALKIQSKVYWNHNGIHSTEIETILTDWKRL